MGNKTQVRTRISGKEGKDQSENKIRHIEKLIFKAGRQTDQELIWANMGTEIRLHKSLKETQMSTAKPENIIQKMPVLLYQMLYILLPEVFGVFFYRGAIKVTVLFLPFTLFPSP